MPQRPVGRAARFDHRSRHDLSRSVADDFWRDLAELTEGNQYCPGRGLSSRWAPKLQIMLVASPRNQLNRHEKVACAWRIPKMCQICCADRDLAKIEPCAIWP